MKPLVKLFNSFSQEHAIWDVFSDFLDLGACSISCTCDFATKDAREARYAETIRKYSPDDQRLFGDILGAIAVELENPRDVLGDVFNELGLYNTGAGQFFTPFQISRMMSDMIIDERLDDAIREKGRVSVYEPACGAGGMIVAFSEAMRSRGYNPQRKMFAVCGDIDLRAVQMTYIQLSLLGISAIVEHKNALTMHTISPPWRTPAYLMGPAMWMVAEEIEKTPKAEAPLGQLSLFEEVSA